MSEPGTNNPDGTAPPPRQLGFWLCLALVVGNMIGSGIFLLPASLAPYGLNSIFGWIFTAVGGVLLAIVFAQLSRVYPQAGGPYIYPRAAFGECCGFVMAWGYWMSVWVGNAAIAIGTIAYLSELVPAIKSVQGGPQLTAVALIWILTFVNWRGVKQAGVFQLVTTVLKVMPLLAVMVLAVILLVGQDASLIKVEPQPFTVSAMTAAATLTLWGLLGLESATVPAENVIDPKRNIPLATLWGTVVTALIYVVACSAVILLIPGSQLAGSTAPFADAVRLFWGDGAASMLALFAFISGFGALNGWILIQGEMPRVLAKEKIFPQLFAHESRYRTPDYSLFITSGLVTIVMLRARRIQARVARRPGNQGSQADVGARRGDAGGALLGMDAVRRRQGSVLVGHGTVRARTAAVLPDQVAQMGTFLVPRRAAFERGQLRNEECPHFSRSALRHPVRACPHRPGNGQERAGAKVKFVFDGAHRSHRCRKVRAGEREKLWRTVLHQQLGVQPKTIPTMPSSSARASRAAGRPRS
jgi:APA family basic amino acid/polyamine antiporter